MDVSTAVHIAAQNLGYTSLKDRQLEVIVNFLSGNDVFAVLPTGYGKSLCYICLPKAFDYIHQKEGSIVIVVAPLTAILKDQVSSLASKGIAAASICGDEYDSEKRDAVLKGHYQLVFFTPECLVLNRNWRKMLSTEVYQNCMRALVVDEAHCIQKWGETFRSVLLRVGELRSLLPPGVHLMALTATATAQTRKRVEALLGMRRPMLTYLSPCKPNIVYSVQTFDSISQTFEPLLKSVKEKRTLLPRVIIYCRKYLDCSNLYSFFKRGLAHEFTEPTDAPDVADFRMVDMFSSCTDETTKNKIIKLFTKQSQLRIVIATVAFGMGINCPDVQEVVHFGSPDDVESYIQETGRAGRNGSLAYATLLKTSGWKRYVDEGMMRYLENDTECRRKMLFSQMEGYEGVLLETFCLCCDVM